jgi:hypothetical protein
MESNLKNDLRIYVEKLKEDKDLILLHNYVREVSIRFFNWAIKYKQPDGMYHLHNKEYTLEEMFDLFINLKS